jgi:excisionase family DNA binding protein
MEAIQHDEYLDVDAVAAQLAVNRASVYRLIREGELHGVVRVGRLWRIPEQAVARFIASGGSVVR